MRESQSMVAGLHKDSSDIKTKLMELERAVRTSVLSYGALLIERRNTSCIEMQKR